MRRTMRMRDKMKVMSRMQWPRRVKPWRKIRREYLSCFLLAFHLPVASYKAPETHACVVSLAYVVVHPFLPVQSEHMKSIMQLN